MASSPVPLGPLVRRWGLSISQLPNETPEPAEFSAFLQSILEEALPFIDEAAPKDATLPSAPFITPEFQANPVDLNKTALQKAKKDWKGVAQKTSRDSTSPVSVLKRVIPAEQLQQIATQHKVAGQSNAREETWAVRLSYHEDTVIKGTADWAEFDRGFRLDHAQTEKAFTPNVIEALESQRWNCDGIKLHVAGEQWHQFQLIVVEMRHKIGRPFLKDRTFPVIQLSCTVDAGDAPHASSEFVVVSIPVHDFAKSPKAQLSNQKDAQIADYVSVERIRRLANGQIEWLLGTASDARGILPLGIQDLALLNIVWKDVPMYMKWVEQNRDPYFFDR
ncbi:hypothetical protein F4808DRAFT_303776 [Astrocystis sublimbata]|nr:hypothetical protein F4808DRAFT_303776 [Astrocystis sublimbata]